MLAKGVGKAHRVAGKKHTFHQTKALDDLQAMLAIQGDIKAFSLLYKRWHPRLLRHALSLAKHREDAHDIMQEAAIAIARNIHRLERPENFGPWAYTIVRNRAANHIKRLQRERTLKTAIRAEVNTQSPPASPPERADTLHDLIETLSPNDHEVLSAYYVDGMSVREISSCLGLPAGTVKSRLYKARTHLKSAYETLKGYSNE